MVPGQPITAKHFDTIQAAVNAANPAGGDTIQVSAGTYQENVIVDRSVTILGPNSSINPNTGTRVAEAVVEPAVTETSLQNSTSGTIFRVGKANTSINVTIKGFTIDGNNPNLTGGRMLNGVEVDTGAGIVNSTDSFDTNPGAFSATITADDNIIENLERYGVLIDTTPASTPTTGNEVSNNLIDNLPSGDNFGGGRGRGVAFEDNAYGKVTNNVMTRVDVGWQDDNYYLADPGGTGTLVSGNTITTYRRGIFHNLQYEQATPATIQNNQIFEETSGDFPASGNSFGVELASIQSGVGVTVKNNSATGLEYGLLLWNIPTTATITVSGGTLDGNQYGVDFTNNDPQFGEGAARHCQSGRHNDRRFGRGRHSHRHHNLP